MTTQAEKIYRQAMKLPESDRAVLAANLLDSTRPPHEDPAEVEAAWDAEIKRRVEEIKGGKVKMVPWQEVYRKAKRVIENAKAKA